MFDDQDQDGYEKSERKNCLIVIDVPPQLSVSAVTADRFDQSLNLALEEFHLNIYITTDRWELYIYHHCNIV